MLGISLIIISTVLLCHTLGSQDMSGLEQRDSKWEGEQSTRWNMWTRLQLSRYAHYWQLRDRRSGGICLMKCSRSGEEGQGWVFLCDCFACCRWQLRALMGCIFLLIPDIRVWGDWDVDNVDRETGPGSTDVNTRLWELSARSHPCH